ncbi:MAG: ribonuclease PH [Nitrospiraceae bacterium]|nr:ribonuclease PH [Nitrospiraceae bacterium]
MRPDGRKNDELRKTAVTVEFISSAPGSVLIEIGKTRVICAATIEEKVPSFLKDQKRGWVTAEYAMLPRSTPVRTSRESSTGRPNGRTQEIQRLIGRSLRAVTDMEALGERTVWLDCDVIEADGGTRTASITGAFLAFRLAVGRAMENGLVQKMPIKDYLAAISVGMVGGERRLDLCYAEDCGAQVDMNVVMTGSGKLVEIQSTAEEAPFSRDDLNEMLSLAEKGIKELVAIQKGIVEGKRP